MHILDGKRAVVIGAASGLGRSLATVLARDGWTIGLVDINDSGAKETLEIVGRAGGTGEVFHADVTVPENIKAVADHFFDHWGGVDLLVNSAGVIVGGFVGDIPLEDWKWIFGVNFWGMMYGCHEFIPRMKAQEGGHILNIASAAGLFSSPEIAPYNATKAAIVALSEALRVEVAPYNIGISVACPMFFKTNLLKTMRYADDWEREMAEACFKHSRMTCDEVARRIIAAVKKDKLYAVPQLSGRALWLIKRLAPEMNYTIFRFLNKHGLLRPVMMRLARWGLL